MDFVVLLIQRVKSEQPEFFKKLQKYALYAIIPFGILYLLLWLEILHVPPVVHDRLNQLCYAGGTALVSAFFTASTATKDPSLVSSDTKSAIITESQKVTENE